jgi:hypothetical protein
MVTDVTTTDPEATRAGTPLLEDYRNDSDDEYAESDSSGDSEPLPANLTVHWLTSSRPKYNIYMFCFARAVALALEGKFNNSCLGCKLSSLQNKDHVRDCPFMLLRAGPPENTDYKIINAAMKKITDHQKVEPPTDEEMQVLKNRCQTSWMNYIRKVMVFNYDMYPKKWSKLFNSCIGETAG